MTCYSSTDLVNWTFEGDVVTREQLSGTEEMGGEEVQWVGRLGVAYMEESGTYAMFVQHEYADPDNSIDAAGGDTSEDGTTKQVLVLTSDSPVGTFKWNQRINMAEYTEEHPIQAIRPYLRMKIPEKTIWYILTDADVEGYLSPRLKSRVTGK